MSSNTSITQYRHRKHLENCIQSLDAFLGTNRSSFFELNCCVGFSFVLQPKTYIFLVASSLDTMI